MFAFVVLYMLFLLDFSARLGVTSMFPSMQKALGLTDSQIGVAGSAVLCGMTLFVLPLSFIADKTSKKKPSPSCPACGEWPCCAGSSRTSSSFCARFMVGMGNASYAPVSVSMLTSWTKKSRWGSVIGLYNSSMSVGLAAGTAVAGILAQSIGWRAPFIVMGVVTLLFMALSMALPKTSAKPENAKKDDVSLKEAFGVTLKNKTLVMLGIGVGLGNMVYSSMVAWIPMFLVREMGWTSAEVGAYMSPVYLFTGIVITPLSGIISDRLGRWSRKTRAWLGVPCFVLLAACFGFGFMLKSFPLIALGVMLFLIPVTGIHIATQELVPARYKASAYGTYVTFLQGLGFFGPMLVGALSDAFGLNIAIVYVQFVFVLGALMLLCAGFTYQGDFDRARALDKR
ncbi:MAG: MFS transporter [Bilophila wadsworthia]